MLMQPQSSSSPTLSDLPEAFTCQVHGTMISGRDGVYSVLPRDHHSVECPYAVTSRCCGCSHCTENATNSSNAARPLTLSKTTTLKRKTNSVPDIDSKTTTKEVRFATINSGSSRVRTAALSDVPCATGALSRPDILEQNEADDIGIS